MSTGKIVVAAAGPLSGIYRHYGLQIEKGVRHAIRVANESGGIHGREVELLVEDDCATVEGAIGAAHRIIAREPSLVVGHYMSDCSLAAAEIYAAHNTIHIAPSTTNPSFTDIGSEKGWSLLFRTCGRDDKQGEIAAEYISDTCASGNVAIVHNGRPYGVGLTEAVRRCLNRASMFERFYDAFDSSDVGQMNLMNRLHAENIAFLYVGGYYTEVGLLLRGLRSKGFMGKIMTGGACASQYLYDIAGSASDGLLLTCRPDARLAPCAIEAVRSIRREGFEPEGYTLSAVAAVQCWAQAAVRCESLVALDIARALRAEKSETSYGTFSFDEKGDVVSPLYAVHRWSNGTYREL